MNLNISAMHSIEEIAQMMEQRDKATIESEYYKTGIATLTSETAILRNQLANRAVISVRQSHLASLESVCGG